MAAQVLGGTGNVSYTNSTGQNVRVVINYLKAEGPGPAMSINTGGASITPDMTNKAVYGKSIAYVTGTGAHGAYAWAHSSGAEVEGVPIEFGLANGGTFSITGANNMYNIVIIPEAG